MRAFQDLTDAERNKLCSKLATLLKPLVPEDAGFAVMMFPKVGDGHGTLITWSPPPRVENVLRQIANQTTAALMGFDPEDYAQLQEPQKKLLIETFLEQINRQIPDAVRAVVILANVETGAVDVSTKLPLDQASRAVQIVGRGMQRDLAARNN
ncbi:MAG: hypothetical protein QM775_16585 [Pirellulales bacterium]